MDSFEQRVARLERWNRCLTAALVIAIGAAVFVAAAPTSTRDVEVRSLQAQELWLVGKDGEHIGFWTAKGLQLGSADDKHGVMLRFDRDKGDVSVDLWSPEAKTRLVVNDERTAIVSGFGKLEDPKGGGKILFSTNKTHGSGFISNSSGNVTWRTE